jgi:uncharacterized membrane protein YhhN
MKKIFVAIFFLVAIIHLLASVLPNETIAAVTKPMLMITLGLYYFFSASDHRSFAVAGAIVFSLAGDVLLLDQTYFIPGLVAFLLAHVFYIFAYRQHEDEEDSDDVTLRGIQRIRLAFPIVLAGTGLVVILYRNLGDFKVPVMLYALVITVMVLKALFRYGRTNTRSFSMVLTGAILFMISDSLIAINKFLLPLSHGQFSVMLTYILAQFLIIEGLLQHFRKMHAS